MSSAAITVSMLGGPSMASVSHHPSTPTASATPRSPESSADAHTPQDLDHRQLSGATLVQAQASVTADRSKATATYFASLGPQAIVDIDPLTGTPRQLTRLGGYLTGAHPAASARVLALDYVRSHLDALGLTSADLSTLAFRQDYVDPLGIHHLSWEQRVDGTPVFGNGLQVNVTRSGRVLSVLGSPVSGLGAMAKQAPAAQLDATQARNRAATNVDGAVQTRKVVGSSRGTAARTTWANHDYSAKVWFLTAGGLRPGWSTYVQTTEGGYQHVIDAATGRTMYRHATSENASGDAYVYRYYPGAPKGPTGIQGGKPKVVNFVKLGWLGKKSKVLDGANVITWADVNDDNMVNPGEQTGMPGTKKGATGALHHYRDTSTDAGNYPPGTYPPGPYDGFDFSKFCSAAYVCTWDAFKPNSWKRNLEANENNAFYLANAFHDYLQNDKVIAFTPKAGNFTAKGGDPVLQQVYDGADTDPDVLGFPDSNHIDNANMNTPPDGTPPTMQMYLWHNWGLPNDYDNFIATSGAFDASVLLHEYTHGLSNRLVIDPDGNSTLNSLQAGSMGEAWSDYYAMDYLVSHHLQKDTSADGEVFEGKYLMGGQKDPDGYVVPFRSMAIDCPVGSKSDNCFDTQNPAANIQGGYTYGDMPIVSGSPEVHASGEVWAQTLWDVRTQFGHTVADTLITRAMSLAAADPSMLDMRNAVLQADQVAYGSSHTTQLWKLFAKRGMGYYAASLDSADTNVDQDFHVPPNPKLHNDSQFIQGTVTDSKTGEPVAGATVTVAGFGSQYSAVTNAAGEYSIGGSWGMYPGTYPKVVAQGAGYLAKDQSVTVPTGYHADADFTLDRDWALTTGGGQITDFNGPDLSSSGCGPDRAIDGSQGVGWGSTVGDNQGTPTGDFIDKHIVVKLPQAVDVSGFGVDPAAACGDPGSASTGDYSIEVSTDGTTWSEVANGHFGVADRGRLNDVAPDGSTDGVRYVRFTIEGNQVAEAAAANDDPGTFSEICSDPNRQGLYAGCQFVDLSELAVFGTTTP